MESSRRSPPTVASTCRPRPLPEAIAISAPGIFQAMSRRFFRLCRFRGPGGWKGGQRQKPTQTGRPERPRTGHCKNFRQDVGARASAVVRRRPKAVLDDLLMTSVMTLCARLSWHILPATRANVAELSWGYRELVSDSLCLFLWTSVGHCLCSWERGTAQFSHLTGLHYTFLGIQKAKKLLREKSFKRLKPRRFLSRRKPFILRASV